MTEEKTANFHVLRETSMPAILTENGFVDTSADANKLKTASFIESLARGHAKGLEQAFGLKRLTFIKCKSVHSK